AAPSLAVHETSEAEERRLPGSERLLAHRVGADRNRLYEVETVVARPHFHFEVERRMLQDVAPDETEAPPSTCGMRSSGRLLRLDDRDACRRNVRERAREEGARIGR